MSRNLRSRHAAGYFIAAILPLLIVFQVFDLWSYDFSIPLNYRGDSTIPSMYAKSISESGWYTHIRRIGMPTGFVLYDYPNLQTVPSAVIRFMSLLGVDGYPRLLNWYFLFSISLTSLLGYLVLRRFGVTIIFSLLGGTVFTLLPYHFMKGVSQLELTSYFIVPLVVFLSVGLQDQRLVAKADEETKKTWIFPSWFGLFSCVLIGLSSIYYVFFSIFTIGLSGIAACLTTKRIERCLRAGVLIFLIGIVTTINFSPVLLHRLRVGDNPLVAERNVDGSLHLSLTMGSLFIPEQDSRFESIRRIQDTHRIAFNRKHYRMNPGSYLGIIGIMGVGILIIQSLKSYRSSRGGLWRGLVVHFYGFLLLGFAGGLGYLFSLFVTHLFRGWERCVVFIAFPAIVAVMLELKSLIHRFRQPKIGLLISCVLCIFLLFVIVEDQMGTTYRRGIAASLDPVRAAEEFRSDELFISRIESLIPPGGMILQLPHTYWPESSELDAYRIHHYDHVLAYLHSRHARWSYPAMRGTPGELWARRTSSKPVSRMLESLAIMDFAGIYIDGWGYPDSGKKIVESLRRSIGAEKIKSENERMIFFSLNGYKKQFEQSYAASVRDSLLALESIVHSWFPGHDAPHMESRSDHWCSSDASLRISNISSDSILIDLIITVETPQVRGATITVIGGSEHFYWDIDTRRGTFILQSLIPPGSRDYDIRTDAPLLVNARSKAKRAFIVRESEIRKARWIDRDGSGIS